MFMLLNAFGLLPLWCKVLSIGVYLYEVTTSLISLVRLLINEIKNNGGLIMSKLKNICTNLRNNKIFKQVWNMGVG